MMPFSEGFSLKKLIFRSLKLLYSFFHWWREVKVRHNQSSVDNCADDREFGKQSLFYFFKKKNLKAGGSYFKILPLLTSALMDDFLG